jgi:hypothetical protein
MLPVGFLLSRLAATRCIAHVAPQVPKEELCAILKPDQLKLRTEKEQRAAVEQVQGGGVASSSGAARTARPQDLGVHPVRSGLWGFVLAEIVGSWGSSHAAFGYDTMHIEDLGVFLYIVYNIPEYLKRKHPRNHSQLLAELEARLRCMPRADDFRLPSPDGGYFSEKGRIQAKEHRAVMQVTYSMGGSTLRFVGHGICAALFMCSDFAVVGITHHSVTDDY